MDPLISAIVWAIVLFFVREAVAALIIWISMLIGVGLAAVADRAWIAVFFITLGWIAAVIWQIFAIVWIIIDVITIIQIATGAS